MKSHLNRISLTLISLMFFAGAQAHAYCWGASANGGCLYYIPGYDQRSSTIPTTWFKDGKADESQLCAPTSSSMAFQGLMTNLKSDRPKIAGWLAQQFEGKAMADQIIATAKLMSTDVKDGTTGGGFHRFAGLQMDYLYNLPIGTFPMTRYEEAVDGDISLPLYQNTFRSGKTGMVQSYGHYTQGTKTTITPTLRQTVLSYTRNGGHVIAPRGYFGDYLIYNDPEGGVVQFSQFKTITGTTITGTAGKVKTVMQWVLPHGGTRASVLAIHQAGTYFPILEDMQALVAPY